MENDHRRFKYLIKTSMIEFLTEKLIVFSC